MDLTMIESSLLLILCVLVSLIFWLSVKEAKYRTIQRELELELNTAHVEFSALTSRFQELEVFQDRYHTLNARYIELKTSLAERDHQHQQQIALFENQKQSLQKEFENLANRIFEEKGQRFTQTSQASIEGLLKPFREQITEFRVRVEGIQKENNESTGSLKKELEQLRVLNQSMTSDAQNLTEALKGDKKKIGGWGEVQLEKTLQQAGLIKGEHYNSQTHYKNASGEHNFPDFVVNLPDGKHIVIDSKVSLIAYDSAVSAKTNAEQTTAMKEHIRALTNHINGLSDKDYSQLTGLNSPSFVLMFLPIEPAYIEAMKFSPELYDIAYRKGIILTSHSTLMPILRTVSNLWVMERSHAESKEMGERAGDIYNQVCLLAERLYKLGGTMMTANKQFNSAVVALTGQQGLHGKVERFRTISIDATKEMPVLEPVHTDIDIERLSVTIENVSIEK